MAKRNYYNRKALFDTGADYLIVYGQNCSGKSYQAKLECIERAMRGERFVYLRRRDKDLNQNIAKMYFDDMPINQLTNGEWDYITAWQGFYYFARRNEDTGQTEKSDAIGAYCTLYNWQLYKSVAFVNYTFIVFEEFITDGFYLDDEPLLLQRFVTIIARDHKVQVMMIGNTICRVIPYWDEWNIPKNQKQGTIILIHMQDEVGEGNEILIAVEYGGRIKGSGSMFFGEASKSIMAGEWSVTNRPRLPKDHIDYEKVYEMILEYQQFSFVLELLVDPDEGTRLLYVYPRTTNRKIYRKITTKFTMNKWESRYFWNTNPELYIQECIHESRVAYSDNLTAADFNNVLAQMGI